MVSPPPEAVPRKAGPELVLNSRLRERTVGQLDRAGNDQSLLSGWVCGNRLTYCSGRGCSLR